MAALSAQRIREHIAALEAFKTAYEEYLVAGPSGPEELRRVVLRKIPAAQAALDVLGGGLVVATSTGPPSPPPTPPAPPTPMSAAR